ncbi:hypothetical protein PALB_19430 [Pseudoalteromonas luteoviolacea B = ATCC 29581]|nr:hypothetical protein PALB_19430 [Pseudoalteromonas luteoviolacea B = ATCC 29581]
MAKSDTLFSRWIEGHSLTHEERDALRNDPEFAPMLKEAEYWQKAASDYHQNDVPDWDRNATFAPLLEQSKQDKVTWFLPLVACSALFAVASSILTFIHNQHLTGQLNAQHQVAIKQQQQINTLLNFVEVQQKNSSERLVDAVQHVLTTSRDERRDEMNALIEYLKTQRAQDQALLKLQLNDLVEQVEHMPTTNVAKN